MKWLQNKKVKKEVTQHVSYNNIWLISYKKQWRPEGNQMKYVTYENKEVTNSKLYVQ